MSTTSAINKWEWWVAPWLAALVDGEGSIMMTRRGPTRTGSKSRHGGSWRPRINVYNTDRRLVDAIKLHTGLGYVVHSVRNPIKETRKKDSYWWSIESGGSRLVAEAILPYMIVKREQAVLLIEARKLIEEHGQHHQNDDRLAGIRDKVKVLNKTGRKDVTT